MRWWRISYRMAGFAAVTAFLYLVRIVPLAVLSRRGDAYQRWGTAVFGLWARLVRRLIGMRIRVSGSPPGPNSFLVTNHLGYVDVVLLATQLPARFVAKSEVADWPVLGRAVRSVGTIFINRHRSRDLQVANCQIRTALERGNSVVLFAEGTSSRGDRVLPMRSPLLAIPAAARLPVAYGAIGYTTPAGCPDAGDAVCWWGDMPFFSHFVSLLALPGFDAVLHFGPTTVADEDRKCLAERLYHSISALHSEIS